MNLSEIKLVSFDAFDTICTLTPTHWLNLVIEQVDTRVTAFNPLELKKRLLCENKPIIKILQSLKLIPTTDCAFVKKITRLIQEEQESVTLFPCSKELVEYIAATRMVAITSNLGCGYSSRFLEELPLVHYTVFSYIEGVSKPSSILFKRLSATAQLAPHEILHIGDKFKNDYQGATNAGLHALHLDIKKTNEAAPDKRIHHISDLIYHLS